MRINPMPAVPIRPDVVAFGAGMDLTTAEMLAKPGTLRLALNYECGLDGGLERVGGIERYDGRAEPDRASYSLLQFTTAATVSLGSTITGATSGATGKVIYVSGVLVGATRTTGSFVAGENVLVSAVVAGVISSPTPATTSELDNLLSSRAAADYRLDIGAVPGSGPVRGLETLDATVYAWRDNLLGTQLVLWRATSAGWVEVPRLYELSFTGGSSEYTDGETITQGGVSALIRRVVLESGAWSGTAAGRLIVNLPTGGSFAAGAAAGGGACTLAGAQAQITLAPGGRVRAWPANLTARLDTKRLYGCDGVNREFELAGDVLVPLNTGMQGIRANAVIEHKKHIFFGFRGSVQHSSIGTPYQYSAVSGASELGTSDVTTDFLPVGGSTDAAALMVLCENSLHVLYGNSSADWNLVPLSRTSGAQTGTVQDAGGAIALDRPGVVRYPATQSFGNFAWDVASLKINKIAAGQQALCSVFIPELARYRVWLADGTALSARMGARGMAEWTTITYGRVICCAVAREVNGTTRCFVADTQGWVYETDVGRSFAGDSIQCAAKFALLTQRSPTVLKRYRGAELELEARGACTVSVSAELVDGEDDIEPVPEYSFLQPGGGFIFDSSVWDSAYYDSPERARKALPLDGKATGISLTIASDSDQELPHVLRGISIFYTPLRVARLRA